VPPSDEFDSVSSDLATATHKLLGALRARGYKRIGFAGWMEERCDDPFYEVRCRSYIQWMRDNLDFDPQICVTERAVDRHTEQSGYRLGQRLMAVQERPDAIVTCNDNMAIGLYRAIEEQGLSVPDDVAVASFNDISVAQFMNPPLSTVRLPAEEIGETAVELLLERAGGRELAKRINLGSQVVWRRSTRGLPQAVEAVG
jgi:LacI family transcriptional regulator